MSLPMADAGAAIPIVVARGNAAKMVTLIIVIREVLQAPATRAYRLSRHAILTIIAADRGDILQFSGSVCTEHHHVMV